VTSVRTDRRSRRRPERSSTRPTWWVLLAVSMAVMALIFARTAGITHRSTSASIRISSNAPTSVKRSAPAAAQPPELRQISPTPLQSPTSTTISTPQPTGRALPSPIPPSLTSTTAASGSIVEYPGYLTYPDNVVSSYPVLETAGDVTASASWATDSTLDVSISCPSGQRSASGTSTVSVSMAVTTSLCTVRLTEETAVVEPISYNLTVAVSPDS
jgi:hypothetical protein